MANPSLAELCDLAASREGPAFTSILKATSGGVDPLGLRQINFDLMDLVFPGLNNVASHIRPFTVVTWAWRRAATCARIWDTKESTRRNCRTSWTGSRSSMRGRNSAEILQETFPVEKCSRLSLPRESTPSEGIPGVTGEGPGRFHRAQCAINYGPGLKTLGWLQPDAEREGAWAATELAEPAIVAFEAEIAAFLHHPAFCKFGPVSIANTDVDQLKEAWALERPTEAERLAMKRSLMGDAAGQRRRDGIRLAIAAVYHLKSSTDVLAVRRTMCGPPTEFVPHRAATCGANMAFGTGASGISPGPSGLLALDIAATRSRSDDDRRTG